MQLLWRSCPQCQYGYLFTWGTGAKMGAYCTAWSTTSARCGSTLGLRAMSTRYVCVCFFRLMVISLIDLPFDDMIMLNQALLWSFLFQGFVRGPFGDYSVAAWEYRDAVAGIAGRIEFQRCLRPAISGSGHLYHARQLYGAVIKCIALPRGFRGMHLGREIVVFGRQKFAELGDWLFPGPSPYMCLNCMRGPQFLLVKEGLRLPLCHHCVLKARSIGEEFYVCNLSVNEVFWERSVM